MTAEKIKLITEMKELYKESSKKYEDVINKQISEIYDTMVLGIKELITNTPLTFSYIHTVKIDRQDEFDLIIAGIEKKFSSEGFVILYDVSTVSDQKEATFNVNGWS